MSKYDVERFCADLKSTMAANLNTRLLAIDAEKADAITLRPVDSDAYFFQELNGKTANYDPYMLYSIEDLPSDGQGPMTSITPSVHFVLVLADTGQDVAIANRLLRYQRAMREVLEENWTQSKSGVKLKISSMVPVQFSLMNSENPFRAIGVAVSGSLG